MNRNRKCLDDAESKPTHSLTHSLTCQTWQWKSLMMKEPLSHHFYCFCGYSNQLLCSSKYWCYLLQFQRSMHINEPYTNLCPTQTNHLLLLPCSNIYQLKVTTLERRLTIYKHQLPQQFIYIKVNVYSMLGF